MAKVNICNVVVLDNPSPFKNPFQFEITFECLENLKEDLEWKIVYVGSAESTDYDQVLDTVLVGPLVGGRHKFVFQAEPPNPTKIPIQDAVGVTVVLLTCSYKSQEFIRVGYYVNNEYEDPGLKENPPSTPDFDKEENPSTQPDFDKLQRNILATCPRVTRFRIDWSDSTENENTENQPPAYSTESESNQMAVDGDTGECSLVDGKEEQVVPNGGISGKVVLSGTSTDSNSLELRENPPVAQETTQEEECMQVG